MVEQLQRFNTVHECNTTITGWVFCLVIPDHEDHGAMKGHLLGLEEKQIEGAVNRLMKNWKIFEGRYRGCNQNTVI